MSAMPINLKLLHAFPINFFILDIDAPKYTIIDASDKHLRELGVDRQYVVGKGVFEAFPDNVKNNFDSGYKLLESFNHVVQYQNDHLVLLQYDIPVQGTNAFEFRYWSVQNSPFFEDGKMKYIFNICTDVTRIFRLAK